MSESILIVEDEDRMRELIKAYLRREGYSVLEAADGKEALEMFDRNSISLVILDIMLPLLDGWTVCTNIREKSEVPIIMLTAKSEEDDKLLGYELGADDYVTKPCSPKVLTAKVKVLLKRIQPNEKSKVQNFDGLKIDAISHEVTIEDKEIYLSPKEYDLLIYFSNNKGITLTRDKILDNVWGEDYYGDLRTVDTHVKRLREKLQDKAYLVATVRGSGYKFEVKK
ncbi:DNA-binding response OmpR family regulator [Clostridium acetobutylicum]|uniref:Stage 0 sporulation protein A homolog n=1 Tax=Clostridium acetobutylicum (strain ATCC 824 / DSM 792 / JCM 1419 / IAM 19013 / LMG 5710 / NBRC 13948 / NRRL B-527 / VKM B-1787 / 2291 / W) TaxID=272562 RepID=Q97GD3_CLOAB|nr:MULTISPECIES: response regulator transcription factor [Clostridium]AAK80389.1 Response regulator (CheY-like domain and HTH-type DNA-binding domain) [Clostridium acetobutylicum ATCC 824]ADZ21486.1 Response regulator (CheY-like domain and HTH-type DNA-binding domain) [Clostridium acetobutylicum EA 2018]AEI32339.1 response regulator [Clostridium acetobutylicum DSM 1731]AWV79192.1 DNA-binding response regulator [Clostridium acetobutylicum]MBC2394843.1 response regulator transcription factor [Cl